MIAMKGIIAFLTIVVIASLSFTQDEQIIIKRIYEQTEDSGEFMLVVEADKNIAQLEEHFFESPQYILDFINAETMLQDINIFENDFIEGINVWRTKKNSIPSIRLSLLLKQAKKPKYEIEQNIIKIKFGKVSTNTNAADKGYIVGPGDVLEIKVFENDELSTTCVVPENRIIVIPLAGEINISNMSVSEITELIAKKLREYIRYPIVSVKVAEYKSQWVNVVGEVKSPGKYYLKGRTFLLDIISEANGLTEKAGSEIIITRTNQETNKVERIVVKREDLSVYDRITSNILLQTGDVITIPAKKYFYIYGEVVHPGSFLLEEGTTILKAISQAGGFTKFASKKNIEVLRTSENGQQSKFTVNIKEIEDRKAEDIEIKPDDIIRVPKSIF
jgi:polysaccharide export outer membrane protein